MESDAACFELWLVLLITLRSAPDYLFHLLLSFVNFPTCSFHYLILLHLVHRVHHLSLICHGLIPLHFSSTCHINYRWILPLHASMVLLVIFTYVPTYLYSYTAVPSDEHDDITSDEWTATSCVIF